MDAPSYFPGQATDRIEREPVDESGSISEIIEQVSGFVRRQFPLFVFILVCSFVLGLVYLLTAPAQYTSHAMLLIDSSKLRVLQQQQSSIGDTPVDTAQVETQVEILKSENIGLSVIKDLHLTDDPEFSGVGGGLLGFAYQFFTSLANKSETELTRKALQVFLQNRTVTRVGRTYVLDIGYASLNPNRASAIANAIADAYIVDQLEAKYQATRRASVWLQDRIKELRTQASVADRAVLDYKEKNNIVDVGGGNSASGSRLLGEQQLGELNTQLGTARAATAEAKARLERIDEVMKRDLPDAAVADSLHNEVITRLRSQYLDLASREAIWSARYGVNHLATVNLRTQMSEIRRSILDELKRIGESYKSDFEIAKARQENVEKSLAGLVSDAQNINRDRLGLRDLESTAQVYHTIYDNFLQRYMEAIQQQSFPITEARVISVAATPQHKSSPIALLVLGVAGAVGLLLSFVVAIVREAIDRVFRTTRQVEVSLNAHCLAVLPLLALSPKGVANSNSSFVLNSTLNRLRSVIPQEPEPPIDIVSSPPKGDNKTEASSSRITGGETGHLSPNSNLPRVKNFLFRKLAFTADLTAHSAGQLKPGVNKKNSDFMRYVVGEPLSAFAEAFRTIKVAADISGSIRNNKVIGVTSTLPKEGKSTVSSNLAQLIAHAGKRVILVDGDLRNPTLTRSLSPNAEYGLMDVIFGKIDLDDAILLDQETGLVFLPTVLQTRVAHTNEILASENFKKLIEDLRKLFDYIIIDFPPIAPVVDVRATTSIVDSYIFVVEWGKTNVNLVQRQMGSVQNLSEKLLGVVLNKANVKVLERYEGYYGRYYYKKYYGRYGYTG